MRYVDIKDQVITTTHSLNLLPWRLLTDFTSEFMGIYGCRWNEIVHPSIKCIVHALMITDDNVYHTVCTIEVDGVAAFFFLTAGYRGEDFQSRGTLDEDACKRFLTYLSNEDGYEGCDIHEIPTSDGMEEIPDLTYLHGQEVLYGIKYYQNSSGGGWVAAPHDTSIPIYKRHFLTP